MMEMGRVDFNFLKENMMAQILVVDDSSTVRNEVGDFLKNNGFSIALAVDGRDGLVKLKADPAIKLIVCDVNMPNMDGLTMAEKVRGELGNSVVSIIMLTTENDPNMKTAVRQRVSKAGSSSPSMAPMRWGPFRSWWPVKLQRCGND